MLQVLPGRNNWNICHPQRAVFQALVPRFLFSLFLPCFTPFGLISNFQKNQKKDFIFKERNIALTFKGKGPTFLFSKSLYKSKGRVQLCGVIEMRVLLGAGPPGATEHLPVDSSAAVRQIESFERCRFPLQSTSRAFL